LGERVEQDEVHRGEIENSSFILSNAKSFKSEYVKSARNTVGVLPAIGIAAGIVEFSGLLDAAIK